MHILRDLENVLGRFSKFPVLGIFGPRQSGKTTLARHYFPHHVYLNFEDPQIRMLAKESPRELFQQHENAYGLILDEFQYVPEILSYVKIDVDTNSRPGYFVLTGSQNFLMNQAVTQSLAGRIGIITLLPLSIHELASSQQLAPYIDETIIRGSYPRIFDHGILAADFYPSYIHSYIERDVRQITNVDDLLTFQKFMQLCAGRIGQLLNLSEIAMVCGISQATAKNWLSLLVASYILFLLPPHHGNFAKRVTKTPKLYFFDTGLACSLLGIKDAASLGISPMRGPLFESFVIADLYKQFCNMGSSPSLYFWRDQNGTTEIDALVDIGTYLVPIEIKAAGTINDRLFSPLVRWSEFAGAKPEHSYLVYTGEVSFGRAVGNLIGWRDVGDLVNKLYSIGR